MTDTSKSPVAMTAEFTDYLAQAAARDRLEAELLPANKTAIFDALTSAGIVSVVVFFDGGGDSGQIESIDARDAAGEVSLPDISVEMVSPSYSDASIDRQALPLYLAIETMAYDLLRSSYCGWENNDGAYGEFSFDVAGRGISLDFNGRYVAVESSSHEF